MFKNKIILITGGTGSFGNACAKHLYKKHRPKKIIIFSRDELKQYEMQNSLSRDGYNIDKFRFFIGDVRDRARLNLAFNDVDFVIHAAALKQIPAAEYNPSEFIKTNQQGDGLLPTWLLTSLDVELRLQRLVDHTKAVTRQ